MKQRILLTGALAALLLAASCGKDDDCGCVQPADDLIDAEYAPEAYVLEYPSWFPRPHLPEGNPLTVAGIELGRRLFYDPILSRDSTMSCASCHNQQLSFADGNRVSTGIRGLPGTRSSMPLINLAYNIKGLFWDGRAATLEEQALQPVEDHLEMDDTWENVVEKLQRHPDYPARFRQAFGIERKREITPELAARAIAQFERTLISYNTRFERIAWMQQGWPTDSEQRGRDLFFIEFAELNMEHPGCSHCHGGFNFTENNFFNNGISDVNSLMDFPDKGLGGVNGNVFDHGKFRTPSLRNIALTAPYMHDGRFATLEEVLDHYASGGHGVANEDVNIQPFTLSAQDKQDLIAFLNMLTDTAFINNPAFSNPFE